MYDYPYVQSNKPDEFDKGILQERMRQMNGRGHMFAPRIGDWVKFPDLDKPRRISHIWTDEAGNPESIQTSAGGSFHLCMGGYISFSGSLYCSVRASSLTPDYSKTGDNDYFISGMKTMPGDVWFFHHDWAQADNAVYFTIPFRVFICDMEAPKS